MSFRVITSHPVDPDSLDPLEIYKVPINPILFVQEAAERILERNSTILEIGCGLGYVIRAFLDRGYSGLGIDIHRPSGRVYDAFMADITHSLGILNDEGAVSFDFIYSFECFEHLNPDRLGTLCLNIRNHMKPGGLFVGSINLQKSASKYDLHRNIKTEEAWIDLFQEFFDVEPFLFDARPRYEPHSMYLALRHKGEGKLDYKIGKRVCPNCRKVREFSHAEKPSCSVCGYVATRYV